MEIRVDWPLRITVPDAAPGIAGILPGLLELRAVFGRFGVDAHQGKRPALETLDQRPLAGVERPAEAAEEVAAEVEDDDLPPVIAQAEGPAIEVLALDLGDRLADGQVTHLVQVSAGSIPQGTRLTALVLVIVRDIGVI